MGRIPSFTPQTIRNSWSLKRVMRNYVLYVLDQIGKLEDFEEFNEWYNYIRPQDDDYKRSLTYEKYRTLKNNKLVL